MSDWSSGYVADLGYTFGFYRELSPSQLSYALASAGWSSPHAASLTVCELGCGQGLSANLLAAAYPQSQVYATDFNPAQIAGARRLAAEAGLANVHFYDDSFAEFLERDLPAFDIVAFHGIWSWIAPEHRRTMVEIVRRKLKPGGLVYNSYNALPGWASGAPLRELLVRHSRLGAGPTAGRVGLALDFAEKLLATNPAYARSNPGVKDRFEKQIKPQNRNYLAHEYFNAEWHPMYFSDVAAEMAPAKLSFAASAHLLDQLDVLNVTSDQQKLLAEIPDPVFRETVRDYMTGAQFRRDIFVKGAVAMPPAEAQARLLDQRFALVVPASEVKYTLKVPVGEVTLQESTYRPLVTILADGPRSTRELLADPRAAGIQLQAAAQALAILVGAGHLHPALPEAGYAERKVSTDRFNAAVLARSKLVAEINYLASPVIGSGVTLDRLSQLFLAAHLDQTEPDQTSWAILRSQNQILTRSDGTAFATPEENLAELQRRSAEFLRARLPVLKQLGVA